MQYLEDYPTDQWLEYLYGVIPEEGNPYGFHNWEN